MTRQERPGGVRSAPAFADIRQPGLLKESAALPDPAQLPPEARQRLEAIVHPLVALETERQAQAAVAKGHRWLVFDVPLLAESKRWQGRCDKVLVIDCSAATQIQRVMARSGLSAGEVQRIIDAQTSREKRLAIADWVILNDGLDLVALQAQVNALPLP